MGEANALFFSQVAFLENVNCFLLFFSFLSKKYICRKLCCFARASVFCMHGRHELAWRHFLFLFLFLLCLCAHTISLSCLLARLKKKLKPAVLLASFSCNVLWALLNEHVFFIWYSVLKKVGEKKTCCLLLAWFIFKFASVACFFASCSVRVKLAIFAQHSFL